MTELNLNEPHSNPIDGVEMVKVPMELYEQYLDILDMDDTERASYVTDLHMEISKFIPLKEETTDE